LAFHSIVDFLLLQTRHVHYTHVRMTRPTLLIVTVVLAITFAFAHAGAIRERRQAIPREFQNVNIENYLKVSRDLLY